MKRFLGCALILALFSVPAFAASSTQSVTLPTAVKVGSSQLPAGDYKVSWTGAGDSVQVTIAKKGVAPVTVQAKVIEQKHSHNGVTTNSQGGVEILQAIELSHVSLVLEGSPSTAGQ